jgi:hypothetical protein
MANLIGDNLRMPPAVMAAAAQADLAKTVSAGKSSKK